MCVCVCGAYTLSLICYPWFPPYLWIPPTATQKEKKNLITEKFQKAKLEFASLATIYIAFTLY